MPSFLRSIGAAALMQRFWMTARFVCGIRFSGWTEKNKMNAHIVFFHYWDLKNVPLLIVDEK